MYIYSLLYNFFLNEGLEKKCFKKGEKVLCVYMTIYWKLRKLKINELLSPQSQVKHKQCQAIIAASKTVLMKFGIMSI